MQISSLLWSVAIRQDLQNCRSLCTSIKCWLVSLHLISFVRPPGLAVQLSHFLPVLQSDHISCNLEVKIETQSFNSENLFEAITQTYKIISDLVKLVSKDNNC